MAASSSKDNTIRPRPLTSSGAARSIRTESGECPAVRALPRGDVVLNAYERLYEPPLVPIGQSREWGYVRPMPPSTSPWPA